MLVDFLVVGQGDEFECLDCWFGLLSAWLVFLWLGSCHFGDVEKSSLMLLKMLLQAECPESLVLLRYHCLGY
ncbi:hypothetical protein DL95DRAFT_398521, partial [Leptodontidium sp. 2 PMI_412]